MTLFTPARTRCVALAATVVLVCGLMCALCACNTEQPDASDAEQYRSFTDSSNRTVQLPVDEIERVAVTNESAQELVLTLAPEKLVGLTSALSDEQLVYLGDACAELPVYGELDGEDAVFNKELLETLKPQVIIDAQPASDEVGAAMDKLQEQTGIPCVHIDTQLDILDRTYGTLGDLLTCSERAQELGAYCHNTYNLCQTLASTAAKKERPRIAYLLSSEGNRTMPQGSAQAAALEAVCENVMKLDTLNTDDAGKETSPEQIALWDPDIILFASTSAYETLPWSSTWADMSAIKDKAYYLVPSQPYNWLSSPVGPNQLLGLQWLTYLCYGEEVDMNLRSSLADTFKTLYGHKLTKSEYATLVENALPAKSD